MSRSRRTSPAALLPAHRLRRTARPQTILEGSTFRRMLSQEAHSKIVNPLPNSGKGPISDTSAAVANEPAKRAYVGPRQPPRTRGKMWPWRGFTGGRCWRWEASSAWPCSRTTWVGSPAPAARCFPCLVSVLSAQPPHGSVVAKLCRALPQRCQPETPYTDQHHVRRRRRHSSAC